MLAMPAGCVFQFGEFVLDTAARRLTRAGSPVVLAERHLDVLRVLLEHAGAIVSKDHLIDTAWQGLAVTDNSLETISRIRPLVTISRIRPLVNAMTISRIRDDKPY
jgi:non-specific serine/threonine protein kinase